MPEKYTPGIKEGKEGVDDNARKFTLDGVDKEFLKANNAVSFDLDVSWLVTDDDLEKKLVYKKLDDSGEVQTILVSKVIDCGKRKTNKEKITMEEYQNMISNATVNIKKKRYEFKYKQGGTEFDMKYDDFVDSQLQLLEVDAKTEEERNKFNISEFPYKITEVSGDNRYTGYRVKEVL